MARLLSPLLLEASIAKPSDRRLIVRLCQRAVRRSDYAIRILPRVIALGGLFLAWDGAALVGMTNFDKCVDGSGWLSVARTDPRWRRRGVAIFLQREIAAYAKRRRVRTLRLWVSSENKPSLRACEKGGFRQVCEAAHISHNLRYSKPHRKVSSSPLSKIQSRRLMKSSYADKTLGYIGYKRHFMKFTKPLLTQLAEKSEFYLTGDTALIVSPPERWFRVAQSSFTILRGPMAKSLSNAKEIAQGMGARILSGYIPYGAYEISVASKEGFTRSPWGKHCLVFEKRI